MDQAPLRKTLIGFLHPEIWQMKVSRIPSCCRCCCCRRGGLGSDAMGIDSVLRFLPVFLRDLLEEVLGA